MPKNLAIYEIKPDKIGKIKRWMKDLSEKDRFRALLAFEKKSLGRELGSIVSLKGRHYAIFFTESTKNSEKRTFKRSSFGGNNTADRHIFHHIIKDCLVLPALTQVQPSYDFSDDLW